MHQGALVRSDDEGVADELGPALRMVDGAARIIRLKAEHIGVRAIEREGVDRHVASKYLILLLEVLAVPHIYGREPQKIADKDCVPPVNSAGRAL